MITLPVEYDASARARLVLKETESGWHTHLGILIDHLNGKIPPQFWSTHARWEAEYEKRLAREDGAALTSPENKRNSL